MENKSVQIGKFRVSPMADRQPDGSFVPCVSIRSGQGSASLERIVRFVHRFATQHAAEIYALKQGLGWVNDPLKYQRGW